MIPAGALSDWAKRVSWLAREQIEQDLLLSRLIVEIANDPYLGDELVFRGGTCLYKLYTPNAPRYSEDLDYVRRSAGGIGQFMGALRDIGQRLGMKVVTKLAKYPKVYLRSNFEHAQNKQLSVKIEVNTYERCPSCAPIRVPFSVESSWFSGSANVQTFVLPELIATKLRAIYQRRKGRDLFDLWYALEVLDVDPDEVVDCLPPYRPEEYTSELAIENLLKKVEDPKFAETDLRPLVAKWPDGYRAESAAKLVIERLLKHVDRGVSAVQATPA